MMLAFLGILSSPCSAFNSCETAEAWQHPGRGNTLVCRASEILKKMAGGKPDAAPKVPEDKKFDASKRIGNRDTWLAIQVRENPALLPHAERTCEHAFMHAICASHTACYAPRWYRTTG